MYYERAGTQHGGKTRRGSPWLRSALVGSARSASRTKTYLGAQYHRLAARRRAKRAFVAVGHTILGIIYVALTTGEPFHDPGVTCFDRHDAERVRHPLPASRAPLGNAASREQANPQETALWQITD